MMVSLHHVLLLVVQAHVLAEAIAGGGFAIPHLPGIPWNNHRGQGSRTGNRGRTQDGTPIGETNIDPFHDMHGVRVLARSARTEQGNFADMPLDLNRYFSTRENRRLTNRRPHQIAMPINMREVGQIATANIYFYDNERMQGRFYVRVDPFVRPLLTEYLLHVARYITNIRISVNVWNMDIDAAGNHRVTRRADPETQEERDHPDHAILRERSTEAASFYRLNTMGAQANEQGIYTNHHVSRFVQFNYTITWSDSSIRPDWWYDVLNSE